MQSFQSYAENILQGFSSPNPAGNSASRLGAHSVPPYSSFFTASNNALTDSELSQDQESNAYDYSELLASAVDAVADFPFHALFASQTQSNKGREELKDDTVASDSSRSLEDFIPDVLSTNPTTQTASLFSKLESTSRRKLNNSKLTQDLSESVSSSILRPYRATEYLQESAPNVQHSNATSPPTSRLSRGIKGPSPFTAQANDDLSQIDVPNHLVSQPRHQERSPLEAMIKDHVYKKVYEQIESDLRFSPPRKTETNSDISRNNPRSLNTKNNSHVPASRSSLPSSSGPAFIVTPSRQADRTAELGSPLLDTDFSTLRRRKGESAEEYLLRTQNIYEEVRKQAKADEQSFGSRDGLGTGKPLSKKDSTHSPRVQMPTARGSLRSPTIEGIVSRLVELENTVTSITNKNVQIQEQLQIKQAAYESAQGAAKEKKEVSPALLTNRSLSTSIRSTTVAEPISPVIGSSRDSQVISSLATGSRKTSPKAESKSSLQDLSSRFLDFQAQIEAKKIQSSPHLQRQEQAGASAPFDQITSSTALKSSLASISHARIIPLHDHTSVGATALSGNKKPAEAAIPPLNEDGRIYEPRVLASAHEHHQYVTSHGSYLQENSPTQYTDVNEPLQEEHQMREPQRTSGRVDLVPPLKRGAAHPYGSRSPLRISKTRAHCPEDDRVYQTLSESAELRNKLYSAEHGHLYSAVPSVRSAVFASSAPILPRMVPPMLSQPHVPLTTKVSYPTSISTGISGTGIFALSSLQDPVVSQPYLLRQYAHELQDINVTHYTRENRLIEASQYWRESYLRLKSGEMMKLLQLENKYSTQNASLSGASQRLGFPNSTMAPDNALAAAVGPTNLDNVLSRVSSVPEPAPSNAPVPDQGQNMQDPVAMLAFHMSPLWAGDTTMSRYQSRHTPATYEMGDDTYRRNTIGDAAQSTVEMAAERTPANGDERDGTTRGGEEAIHSVTKDLMSELTRIADEEKSDDIAAGDAKLDVLTEDGHAYSQIGADPAPILKHGEKIVKPQPMDDRALLEKISLLIPDLSELVAERLGTKKKTTTVVDKEGDAFASPSLEVTVDDEAEVERLVQKHAHSIEARIVSAQQAQLEQDAIETPSPLNLDRKDAATPDAEASEHVCTNLSSAELHISEPTISSPTVTPATPQQRAAPVQYVPCYYSCSEPGIVIPIIYCKDHCPSNNSIPN